jgi:hypothetical protein
MRQMASNLHVDSHGLTAGKTAETFKEFAATAISHHGALNDQLVVRRPFYAPSV